MRQGAFESFDGTEIVYYRWGDEDTEAPPVVLHHGFAANAQANWVLPGVVSALTDAGRGVVAVDARGHGASGKSHDPEHYGDTKMSRDLIGLFDVLGADRVHLAGYSMGAVVSLVTANEDKRVERLVVGGIGAAVVERNTATTDRSAVIVEALLAEDPSTVPPAGVGLRALADRVGADRLALAAVAKAARLRDIEVDRITAATLVLVGQDDPVATRPDVLAAAIGGATVRLLPGDHLGAVRDPGFAASIVDFFAG
jgi:pimeloyl-ACP methyl ester carboxylesterase